MTSSESLRSQVEKRIAVMQKAQSKCKRGSPNWMCHSFIIIELEQVLTLIDKMAKELVALGKLDRFTAPGEDRQVWLADALTLLVGNNQKELGAVEK